MKKIFIPIACLAMLFAACTDTEVIEKGTSPDLVSFSTYMGQSTRAAATTTENFDNFGVSAYYSPTAQWATSKNSASCNYMDNDKVTGSSGEWTYDHPKYWPKSGYVNFWAWSPAESNNIAWGTQPGVPNFTYTVQDAVTSQEDLVVALATDQEKGASGKVSLTFSHLLSKIGFSAKLAGEYSSATVKVTEMKVTYKASTVENKGVYTYDPVAGQSIWATPSGGEQYANATTNSLLASPTTALNPSTATALNDADKFLMLLPQSAGDDALSVEMKYTVSYDDDVETTNVETIELPGKEWEPGKQYTYNFTISLTGVEFDVTSVTPWGDAAVVEIENKPITEFAGTPIALGYAATSKAEFSTSGISKIDPVDDEDFSVSYSATNSKAISGVTGTLTFTTKTENNSNAVKTQGIPVTIYDVLGNKSTVTFTVSQAAKIDIFKDGTSISGQKQSLLYNSEGTLYSINNNQTNSVSYTIAGVTSIEQIVIGEYDSDVFTVNKTTGALTFTDEAAAFGDTDKSTTFTVILNDTEGELVNTYTFELKRCAKPAMKNGANVIEAGIIPEFKFKSNGEAAADVITTYTLINTASASGFITNGDFSSVTNNENTSIAIAAKGNLTAAGNSNKTHSGTLVLTNACGETTSYTMLAKQYAAAYMEYNSAPYMGARLDLGSGFTVQKNKLASTIKNGEYVNFIRDTNTWLGKTTTFGGQQRVEINVSGTSISFNSNVTASTAKNDGTFYLKLRNELGEETTVTLYLSVNR